jgi:hypothetical protein
MLKVKNIGSNKTEVHTDKAIVLVSYETPVACFLIGTGPCKTEDFWSVTTSKHINQWFAEHGIDSKNVSVKPQSFFDELLN